MVGTAGHIDHGKSSLVRALTGIDPDRLKEEKERGLTIDLGFAPLELSDGRIMGMVDVPGHERFVRNMVAGSTGLDLAILVVAADDSVMPQTLEHLEILDLLGVRLGLVALTKIDLVDAEMREFATDEIRETLEGTSLAGAEIMPLSTITREGLDAFRKRLEEIALATAPRSSDGPFRMSIQRVFQLKGIGTVITGIPSTGVVHSGDVLEFLPSGKKSKVRALQAYGGEVEEALAGHSTALSVPEIKAKALKRGEVVAVPGIFQAGDAIDIDLRMLPQSARLDHRTPIRFHTGTIEMRGLLSLLDRDQIEPGDKVVARILLEEEISCAHGDPFLLRTLNPVRTVGGGEILRVGAAPRRYRRSDVALEIQRLLEAGSDPKAIILEAATQGDVNGCTPDAIAAQLAIDNAEATAEIRANEDVYYHERGQRAFLPGIVRSGKASVLESVEKMLKNKPLAASISRAALRTSRTFPAVLKEAVLDLMQAEGEIRSLASGMIMFQSRLRALAPEDQKDLDRMVAHCEALGFKPPAQKDLLADLGFSEARLGSLLARAKDEDRLATVGDHVYGGEVIRLALRSIRSNCSANGDVLDIPKLRDVLGTSRKYLIPLLEYVDSLGLTILRGGERRLLTSSELNLRLAAEGV